MTNLTKIRQYNRRTELVSTYRKLGILFSCGAGSDFISGSVIVVSTWLTHDFVDSADSPSYLFLFCSRLDVKQRRVWWYIVVVVIIESICNVVVEQWLSRLNAPYIHHIMSNSTCCGDVIIFTNLWSMHYDDMLWGQKVLSLREVLYSILWVI